MTPIMKGAARANTAIMAGTAFPRALNAPPTHPVRLWPRMNWMNTDRKHVPGRSCLLPVLRSTIRLWIVPRLEIGYWSKTALAMESPVNVPFVSLLKELVPTMVTVSATSAVNWAVVVPVYVMLASGR